MWIKSIVSPLAGFIPRQSLHSIFERGLSQSTRHNKKELPKSTKFFDTVFLTVICAGPIIVTSGVLYTQEKFTIARGATRQK